MSLNLTKVRGASHDHISAAGSYTDSYIEVQGTSITAESSTPILRWVPNNKTGGHILGVDSSNLASAGYNQWNSFGTGWNLFKFSHFSDGAAYDGSSTSPGLRLLSHLTYTNQEIDEMAGQINDYHNGLHGTIIYVIVTSGYNISSNATLAATMNTIKSWQFSKHIGGNEDVINWSYCAVGSSYGRLGLIAESLQGPGLGHQNAYMDLAIEHDYTAIGHAGYGEELSSGVGAGENEMTSSGQNTLGTKYVYWNTNNYLNTELNEYLRFSFQGKIGQGAGDNGGWAGLRLTEQGVAGLYVKNYSVDAFAKQEYTYRRQSASSTNLKIETIAYSGNGTQITGSSDYDDCTIKDLQVFKCGYGPDQDRDGAVHKWHMNGRDIIEGPGDFDVSYPTAFYDFYGSARNLIKPGQNRPLSIAGSSDIASLLNYQYKNGTVGTSALGQINGVHWFDRDLKTTADTDPHYFVQEVRSAGANQHTDFNLADPNSLTTGIDVDTSKMYMAGVWVRVRHATHASGQALSFQPTRISILPQCNVDAKDYLGNIVPAAEHYGSSIENTTITNNLQEWKLLSCFYLPDSFTDSEVLTFTNSYWAKWAAGYEYGNGTDISKQTPNTGYGIMPAQNSKVAVMHSSVTKIIPILRTELYQGNDMWLEAAYPFVLEMDPFNITAGGDFHFWDFTEI